MNIDDFDKLDKLNNLNISDFELIEDITSFQLYVSKDMNKDIVKVSNRNNQTNYHEDNLEDIQQNFHEDCQRDNHKVAY